MAAATGYVTSARTRNAIASALSYTCNPRNLEDGYYPSYNCTLTELFDDFQNLRVCAEPNLQLSSAELEMRRLADLFLLPDMDGALDAEAVDASDDDSDHDTKQHSQDGRKSSRLAQKRDAEEVARQEDQRAAAEAAQALQIATQEAVDALLVTQIKAADPEAMDGASAADTSFSSQGTIPDQGSLNVSPDLALCHTVTVEVPKPTNLDRLYTWKLRRKLKVVHECFRVFLEIKSQPTRRQPNDIIERRSWQEDRDEYLAVATSEIIFYLVIYFARDLSAKSVVAMVASGLHWKWLHCSRHEIPELDYTVPLRKSAAVWKDNNVFMAAAKKFEDAPTFALGSEKSDRALTEMRAKTLQIVEDHVAYRLTMLPTKAKGKGQAAAEEDADEGNSSSDDDQSQPGSEQVEFAQSWENLGEF
ncbi:hypothetical protein HGRIS_014509 [Hohenbuehelia grisea]|uniref:Uncharacterized protein n=1 Tax=Hohenbuehelia grisea TaxID=104357 RepID=A0ABR3JVT8_9AGAR